MEKEFSQVIKRTEEIMQILRTTIRKDLEAGDRSDLDMVCWLLAMTEILQVGAAMLRISHPESAEVIDKLLHTTRVPAAERIAREIMADPPSPSKQVH